jgi:RIO kinase 2
MEKDLLASMGIDDGESEENEETSTEEDDLEALRKNVDDIMIECDKSEGKTDEKDIETSEIVNALRTNEFVTNQSDVENKPDDLYPDPINNKDNMSDDDKLSAIYSVRSVSTTSTIPPEVIRERVKKALEKREANARKHRVVVKGEASAVTRKRRENRDTIKDSDGIWGWNDYY